MKNFTPNTEQLQVEQELNRNILMLASAGTGKTNTVARRILHIIRSQKAMPSEILCITFTNRACKEMRERIASTIGADAGEVVVKTIHSFCFDIIKAHAKEQTALYSDFVIFDEDDCLEIIKSLKTNYPPVKLQRFFEKMKTQRALYNFYSDDAGKDYLNTFKKLAQGPRDGFNLLMSYQNILQEMNALDFDDLLTTVHEMFRDFFLKKKWGSRFKYIHVDEVQDVNMLEFEVLRVLFGENNILLCGDFFQTIYAWRGSEPQTLMAKFEQEYNPIHVVLSQNYRATKNLVQASYETLKNLFFCDISSGDSQSPLEISCSISDEGEKIMLYAATDVNAEALWVYKNIKNAPEGAKICILARTNSYCQELGRYLKELSPQFLVIEEFKFFRRAEIKDLLAFIKLLTNKHDTLSFKRIILSYAKGLGKKTIDHIEESGLKLYDFLENGRDPFSFLLNGMSNVIVFDVESTGTDTTTDEIIQIAAFKLDFLGNVCEKFEVFIKPSRPVGNSLAIHNISDAFLHENGKEPKEALESFLLFAEGTVVVGHNVSYDINILTSQNARYGLCAPQFLAVYDTLELTRRYYPSLKSHKLSYLCEYFKLSHKPTHNAADDVETTRQLLNIIVNDKIKPETWQRKTYIAEYSNKFKAISVFITQMSELITKKRPAEVLETIIERTNMKRIYTKKGEAKRNDSLDYFIRLVKDLDEPSLCPKDSLINLLALTSLSNSELDTMLNKTQKIPVITVHQAKGLEFDNVFISGLQQNTFPPFGVNDEEKRVFYVAMTRAKKMLFLSYAANKGPQSELIGYVPDKFVDAKV